MRTKQTKIDQWSDCDTPEVWRSDNLVSNPEKDKEEERNKRFALISTSFYPTFLRIGFLKKEML